METHHSGQNLAAPQILILPKSLPIRSDIARIAYGYEQQIRSVTQDIHQLKCSRFLAFDTVRINRVYQGDIISLGELTYKPKRGIKIAVYHNDFGAVNHCLG